MELRDSRVPAGKMGSASGEAGMCSSSWKNLRMALASSKSPGEPARCGWLAYAFEVVRALSWLGTDLRKRR